MPDRGLSRNSTVGLRFRSGAKDRGYYATNGFRAWGIAFEDPPRSRMKVEVLQFIGRHGEVGLLRTTRSVIKTRRRHVYTDNLDARRYGKTSEEIRAMRESNECDACGGPSRTPRRMAIDHNHKTGKMRGKLCTRCNGYIGVLEKLDDNPVLKKQILDYLTRYA